MIRLRACAGWSESLPVAHVCFIATRPRIDIQRGYSFQELVHIMIKQGLLDFVSSYFRIFWLQCHIMLQIPKMWKGCHSLLCTCRITVCLLTVLYWLIKERLRDFLKTCLIYDVSVALGKKYCWIWNSEKQIHINRQLSKVFSQTYVARKLISTFSLARSW